MEVEFGSALALQHATEQETIRDFALEEGLKKYALNRGAESSNIKTHTIEKPTTNVLCVKFNSADQQNLYTGDPVYCSKCVAVLNHTSVLTEEGRTWTCEFCGIQNQLGAAIDPQELPTTESVDYLLQPPKPIPDDQTVIFCLDVSGSMATTAGSKTRLQVVKASVDEQLQTLALTKPETRVGLVIFESTVTFFGDGTPGSRDVTLAGKELDDYEMVAAAAQACKLSGKIRDTVGALRDKVARLQTLGGTALGPALALSTCVAATGKGGSQVIICTDGEANEGIGSMSGRRYGRDDAGQFYTHMANVAKEKGVSVSVISFVGTQVSLEKLAVLAEATGGTVKMTESSRIAKNMGSIITENVIAYGATLSLYSSPGVVMSYPETRQQIGNVIKNSDTTVPFTVGQSIPANTNVTFQAKITYTRVSDGAKLMKVITKRLQLTNSREEAESRANIEIICMHTLRATTKLAQAGTYIDGRLTAYAYEALVDRIARAQGAHDTYRRFLEELEILDGEMRFSERQEEKSGLRAIGDRDRDRDRDRARDRVARRDDCGANVVWGMGKVKSDYLRRSRSRSPPKRRHRSRSRSPTPPPNTTTSSRSPTADSRSPQRMRSCSPPPKRRERERDERRDRDDRRDRDRDDRRDRERDDRRDRDRDDRRRDRYDRRDDRDRR